MLLCIIELVKWSFVELEEFISKKRFPQMHWNRAFEAGYSPIKDVIQRHQKVHPLKELPNPVLANISNDGVAESQSSNLSFNSWVIQFSDCVWPIRNSKTFHGIDVKKIQN
jgi:hypothetical protein